MLGLVKAGEFLGCGGRVPKFDAEGHLDLQYTGGFDGCRTSRFFDGPHLTQSAPPTPVGRSRDRLGAIRRTVRAADLSLGARSYRHGYLRINNPVFDPGGEFAGAHKSARFRP
jgi:hypothetical protein